MSKIITYRCNLCFCVYQPDQVVGIRFEGTHSIEAKLAIECECHLCKKCISAIDCKWTLIKVAAKDSP